MPRTHLGEPRNGAPTATNVCTFSSSHLRDPVRYSAAQQPSVNNNTVSVIESRQGSMEGKSNLDHPQAEVLDDSVAHGVAQEHHLRGTSSIEEVLVSPSRQRDIETDAIGGGRGVRASFRAWPSSRSRS
jgi:hypothetical protein